MKGVILDNRTTCRGPNYSPNLKPIFKELNGFHKKLNWLITNYECFSPDEDNEKYVELLKGDGKPIWVTGEELDEIIMTDEELYWIWGVLSAFKKDVSKEDVLKYEEPWADGYTGFWQNPISIQHPSAEVEIVPWDSSLVLLISKEEEIINEFRKHYPLAKDLEKYNVETFN